MAKATEGQLGTLHGAVARKLTDIIENGEVVGQTEDGQPLVKAAGAAYFAVATAFLKNNDITADRGKNEELAGLSEALQRRRQARKASLSGQRDPGDVFEAGMATLVEQGKGLMQ